MTLGAAPAEELDASLRTAVDLGGRVLQGPEDTPFGRLAAVADPAGAVLKLVDAPVA